LAVRFLLEIAMLIALGLWGWHLSGSWLRYVAAAGLPFVAAALWGILRIPNDPKPAPVAVPGIIRLLLELGLFGSATWALYDLGYSTLSIIMAVIIVIHYLVSYDRTWVMLRNKPYTGFVK
ncbi:MAG TPA: YrdB family protein, partial [Mucilaginibacter sp.]|nr:YrdB family protein [Mucilaginibacter sp.]